ncbi:hypothetical protein B1759_12025 [Rubrivirga sp. SAORIC476]|nr:hypothetical protein B1759_12025 [Rubrivirga sp. SAORIC476]
MSGRRRGSTTSRPGGAHDLRDPLDFVTGLGLSLAHDIVDTGLGGALAVDRVEGEGSTSVLRLP